VAWYRAFFQDEAKATAGREVDRAGASGH